METAKISPALIMMAGERICLTSHVPCVCRVYQVPNTSGFLDDIHFGLHLVGSKSMHELHCFRSSLWVFLGGRRFADVDL